MLKFAPLISIYDFDESKEIQTEVIWAFSINLKGIAPTRHRFNIHVVQTTDEEQQHLNGSILSVWKYASMSTYSGLSKREQKYFLLTFIYESLLESWTLHQWNRERILNAFEKTLSGGIQFNYNTRPIWNKQKSNRASTELVLHENTVTIRIVFTNHDQSNPVTRHLIDTSPLNLSFFHYFGKPVWLNNTTFGFLFKNGMTLTVSTENQSADWSIDRNLEDEWFRKMLDLNEQTSPEALVKIMNQ